MTCPALVPHLPPKRAFGSSASGEEPAPSAGEGAGFRWIVPHIPSVRRKRTLQVQKQKDFQFLAITSIGNQLDIA
jgi:hypothetical protein